MINVAIVDDHALFCKALKAYFSNNKNYLVTMVAYTGAGFIFQLRKNKATLPDVVLLDIRMPGLSGIDTASILKNEFPSIKIIAISCDIDTEWVCGMLQNGALAYISKSSDEELFNALPIVLSGNYYYNNIVTKHTVKFANTYTNTINFLGLNEQQIFFIKLCETNLAYKQIAELLNMQEPAFEKMRSRLFQKLNVVTRQELAFYGIKKRLYTAA
ncbi:MAG: response regulator transcription factor [Bacteroidetes bacterium]|nr:response regulator transcription factor [Bacteroidota bacterium]MBS1592145.1 response regulator transcription factor [Bacteroidota bacterium]